MKPHLDHTNPGCAPVRHLLQTIGSKWAVLLVTLLSERPKRFSELMREVSGITQKSLTSILRELEKNGIVERMVTPTIPPRVDYALTPLGTTLLGPLDAVQNWAIENSAAVEESRSRYESRNNS
ncbi:transcriptional regulator [Agrobacterium salinitolerans]|uniref:Transcriptional regulator n=1 Tax=Agrobacterium pusense TaxID=648995 RepID=U4Q4C0_9HYPH|nr:MULTISPECIES: helix-turn-helix domain-containing protein [Agrobacterium]OOO27692.1 transcriptional regulator [Agrobacterium salinitolerans]PNQ25591.1 transcriptional regulator [Rhizobium sp. YIC5082]CDI12154.1 putative transcriptional regulator [Agrobacterium pusense]